MNAFLKNLEITFRRDPTNYRPRINKKESTKDREQKLAGTFYYRGWQLPLQYRTLVPPGTAPWLTHGPFSCPFLPAVEE